MEPGRSRVLVGLGKAELTPRSLFLLLALLTTFLARPNLALAWGPTAHDIVDTWAIQTLPPEIRPFLNTIASF